MYLWWSDFLNDDTLNLARDVIRNKEHLFRPSTTSGEADYRISKVLFNYDFPEFSKKFTDRIWQMMPHIRTQMNYYDHLSYLELQMTAHNDGGYFKIHNDNGTPDCKDRKLTVVYYFDVGDRMYEGGELILDTYRGRKIIQPNHNSVIIFPSQLMHEVKPVKCTGNWLDGRITANGWLH